MGFKFLAFIRSFLLFVSSMGLQVELTPVKTGGGRRKPWERRWDPPWQQGLPLSFCLSPCPHSHLPTGLRWVTEFSTQGLVVWQKIEPSGVSRNRHETCNEEILTRDSSRVISLPGHLNHQELKMMILENTRAMTWGGGRANLDKVLSYSPLVKRSASWDQLFIL